VSIRRSRSDGNRIEELQSVRVKSISCE
jgi:hypothetical protein